MLCMRCKIETFKRVPQENWEVTEWGTEPQETFESLIFDGGINVHDIQFYVANKEDRVSVSFKNGCVVSIVTTLQEFERDLGFLELSLGAEFKRC